MSHRRHRGKNYIFLKIDEFFNSVWPVQKVTDLISTEHDLVLIVLMSHITVKGRPKQTSVEYNRALSVLCCKLSSHHTHKGYMSWLLDAIHSRVSNHDKSGFRTMSVSFVFSFFSNSLAANKESATRIKTRLQPVFICML